MKALLCFPAQTLTAIEVWLVACIVFIFLALVEFGFVLIISQRITAAKAAKSSNRKDQISAWSLPSTAEDPKTTKALKISKKVDSACIWILPILFLCFNAIYWLTYSN